MKPLALMYVLGFLTAVSCGGGGKSTPDGGSGGLTQAEACAAATPIFCDKVFTCDELASFRAVLGTREGCATVGALRLCPGGSVCATGQTYHGDVAPACRDGLSALSCADIATIATASNPLGAVPACAGLCTGP